MRSGGVPVKHHVHTWVLDQQSDGSPAKMPRGQAWGPTDGPTAGDVQNTEALRGVRGAGGQLPGRWGEAAGSGAGVELRTWDWVQGTQGRGAVETGGKLR